MDAEKRFHNQRMEYVKYCIHMRHNVPLESISATWTMKDVSIKGQIIVKTVQSGNLKYIKYQDVEAEVEEEMQKMAVKKLVATSVSSREKGMKRREEGGTMSRQKTNKIQRNDRNERCTSEGGSDKLKKADGDFPICMMKKRDINVEIRKMEDLKGTGGGRPKHRTMDGDVPLCLRKTEKESNDGCSSKGKKCEKNESRSSMLNEA